MQLALVDHLNLQRIHKLNANEYKVVNDHLSFTTDTAVRATNDQCQILKLPSVIYS